MNARMPLAYCIKAGFAASLLLCAIGAHAGEREDRAFFEAVAGQWSGPGKIVEGKMKGTRFTCALDGLPLTGDETGFRLDGKCRTGMFSHPVSAVFIRDGETYRGQFLDGEDGDGLNVVGGAVKDSKAVIDLKRHDITGALVTNLQSDDDLNITLLIKGGTRFVPVIGLSLKRDTDNIAVGAVK